MKQTLLEIVQNLLGSVEDDEVNSINDVESAQRVANIVKECFYEIVAAGELPEHYDYFELDTDGDITKPTLMYLPEDAGALVSLKYNRSTTDSIEFTDMKFLTANDFVDMMYQLDPDEDNVLHFTKTTAGHTIDFLVLDDKMPEYYTTFNDNMIVFDSYDADVDTFLVKNKTLVYGQLLPEFELTDEYVPDLDAKQFSLLINEAKRQVFNEFRQSDNPLSAQRARRGWIRLQRDKRSIPNPYNSYNDFPNYGRKTR